MIEPLESRIAPAGVVAVAYNAATGELTLTGDALGNTFDVIKTGPATHRIQVTGDTTLTGGVLAQDIGQITKLTILAGDGDDVVSLENLTALTQLSLDAGGGGGEFTVNNTKVSGAVNFTGGAGGDAFIFGGLSTNIGGNLTINDTAGGGLNVHLSAQTSVIGGSLLITGGNGFVQFHADAAGTLIIGKGVNFQAGSGASSINFDSQAGTTIGKLSTGESVLFAGGDGSDGLSFSGKSASLAGGVRMTGGDFNDALIFGLPGGVVKIGRLTTGQSILFDGGLEDDIFRIDATSIQAAGSIEIASGPGVFDGELGGLNSIVSIGKRLSGESIKFTGGAGSETFTMRGAAITLAGGIDFTGNEGGNTLNIAATQGAVKIGKLLGGASIKYDGGGDNDTLSTEVARLTLAGGVDFSGGDGQNTLTLGGADGRTSLGKLVTGESVKYLGGLGGDNFAATAGFFITAGGVSFTGGDGSNSAYFFNTNGTASIGKLPTGQSVLYTGGAGDDEFRASEARVVLAGGLEFSGGNGENLVTFHEDGVVQIGTLATGQSIKVTGGSGDDAVQLGGHSVVLKGSIEMVGGGGFNTIGVEGANVSVGQRGGTSISLTGGASIDKIDLRNNVTLGGSIFLDGAAGNDRLNLTNLARLKVGGDITFLGGTDNDQLNLDVFALQAAGKLTFTGGDGNDSASLVADGQIAGDVTLDLGGASANGIQAVTLASRAAIPTGLVLKGALDITATGAALTFDALSIRDIAVQKAINVSLGAGVSSVVVDNLTANDTFDLATGDGADVVEFERHDLFGNSIIAKIATIQTGAGADTVLIGSATLPTSAGSADSTRVRFLGGLTVDGGAGTDSGNDFTAENTITGTPTLLNFETEIERI